MKNRNILKRLEILLILATFILNFGPVIYYGFKDAHSYQPRPNEKKVLFQTHRYTNIDGRLRNLGYALLTVSLSEMYQLVRPAKK
ncbi:hypothetical protein [Limosilactobacillus frumenti]|uniref:hypothetical protein n=1 Tax=Limosilactobacillus frumenti TaxID=104955 RepID=UPI0007103371|nr:hypothetical protein [Limosilactobacillus frumenti]MBA2913800.1 hypothetical protein [Limosilactobacillus frumenti]QFG72581.1 hypothetical protein LF145_04165 [Limosilactobacillus frumenti]